MKIQDILRALQNEMRPMDAFWALIEISYSKNSGSHFAIEDLHCRRFAQSDTALMMLEGAADLFLKLDRHQRYKFVEDFLDAHASDPAVGGHYWIRKDASDLLLSMVGDTKKARFSFAACFRPFFQFYMNAKDEGRSVTAEFVSGSEEVERNAFNLGFALGLDIELTSGESPFGFRTNLAVDVEVMLPPLGASVAHTEEIPNALLKHLGVTASRHGRISYESLCIAHSLEHDERQTIVAVTEGALVRTVGTEASARRDLVESARISKAISAPAGLVYTSTGVSLGLLVVAFKSASADHVYMGRLPKDPFSAKQESDRALPLAFATGGPTGFLEDDILARCSEVRLVPVAELEANNFILAPNRYLNTGAREAIDVFASRYEMAELQDMVEMIRPVNLQRSDDGEYTILEAAPADVGRRGYLQAPAREFHVDRATYNRALQQQVRPGDVVIAIKGTIGVIGLVPDEAQSECQDKIWTAGQSLMILRPKPRSGLDSVVLYEFLSNDTVQEFISTMAGGSVIKNLGMKDLKVFPVPVPTEAQVSEVHEKFSERQEIFDVIEDLEGMIVQKRAEQWPHADLDS